MIYQHIFDPPLIEGQLIKRYKRFLSDIKLNDGRTITALCMNTGSMEGITTPGNRVWVAPALNQDRKLKWDWEVVEANGGLIGCNTGMPNRIVKKMLQEKLLSGFKRWSEMKPEKKYCEHSRVDFWLVENGQEHYIEVKNVHLLYPDNRAYFPDSVTQRGTKHLNELAEMVKQGHKSTVLFFVQCPAKSIRPSDHHDPDFAQAARKAAAAGVKFKALQVQATPQSLNVEKFIPVDLKPYKTDRMEKWRTENRK